MHQLDKREPGENGIYFRLEGTDLLEGTEGFGSFGFTFWLGHLLTDSIRPWALGGSCWGSRLLHGGGGLPCQNDGGGGGGGGSRQLSHWILLQLPPHSLGELWWRLLGRTADGLIGPGPTGLPPPLFEGVDSCALHLFFP